MAKSKIIMQKISLVSCDKSKQVHKPNSLWPLLADDIILSLLILLEPPV